MILIGLGANLESETYGPPRATCGAALERLADDGISIVARARWYRTAPVPISDQPWYVNGVVRVATGLGAEQLLERLLTIEQMFGRRRGERNAPRTIDLDLLAHGDHVLEDAGPHAARIPHPRMSERAFVLMPLAEVAPDWRHPITGEPVNDLIARLPVGQTAEAMADADGLHGTEWHGH